MADLDEVKRSTEERLARLEQQVKEVLEFKERIEARLDAGDKTVINLLHAMEARNEEWRDALTEMLQERFRKLDDLQERFAGQDRKLDDLLHLFLRQFSPSPRNT